jgi:hypothetical protein
LSFRLAVGFAAVGLAGCGDDSTGPILCTEEFRLGISIQVRGAEGTITEEDYVEVLQIFGDDTMAGAGERAGTYDIRITKPGFNEWTASQVTVTADECHVRTVGLEANLVAIP